MTRFQVIEAKPHHCGQIIRIIRNEHKMAMAQIGVNDGHGKLRQMFQSSYMRVAWMIDGKLAAIGGVSGTAIGFSGQVWLAVAERAVRFPVEMVKESRRQLARIMEIKDHLVTTIAEDDKTSKRFAEFMGFQKSLCHRTPMGYGHVLVMECNKKGGL